MKVVARLTFITASIPSHDALRRKEFDPDIEWVVGRHIGEGLAVRSANETRRFRHDL